MADKAIGELIAAEKVNQSDLFVLEQDGAAKKLTGQILENWLLAMAQGHGGIQSIDKVGTSGLVDTYRITLADTSYFDFPVTNGKSITGVKKSGTAGLVDTHTISYNDGSTSTFTVTNGAKGDKGDNAYTWIKYASQEPTESSHSMGDIPDDWRGEYNGPLAEAPTDWKQYKWYKIKGEKGATGDPATLMTKSVTYQVSDSGMVIPSGSWLSAIPNVPQGKYLWTRTVVQFNTGDPVTSYTVARMGIDGTGAVSTVAGVSPDATGNVTLTAADVGALAVSGGGMTGGISMNGQPISGLNDPTEESQAARKGYVDASVRKAAPRNLLDNSDFRNPVNQRGLTSVNVNSMFIDRWRIYSGTEANRVTSIDSNGLTTAGGSAVRQIVPAEIVPKDVSKYTFAVCDSDGKITIIDNIWKDSTGNLVCAIQDAGTYIWAALYEGTYTAETLPEYQPKGYVAELLECKRYYQVVQPTSLFLAQRSDLLFANIRYSTMRSIPSISLAYTKVHLYSDTHGFDADVNIKESIVYEDGATIGFSTNGATQGKIYRFTKKVPDFIILTADL